MDKHIELGILWTGYCVVHSIMAAASFKKRIQLISGKAYKYYRLFYSAFATVTLVAIIIFGLSFTSPEIFKPSVVIKITGGIITIGGLIIMGICFSRYFIELSGMFWLNAGKAQQKNELITTGMNQYVRHPLYLGTFIFIWGLFLLFPILSVLITDGIITIYTLIGIAFEEKKLIQEFGDAYREYRRRVPMIIPKFKQQ